MRRELVVDRARRTRRAPGRTATACYACAQPADVPERSPQVFPLLCSTCGGELRIIAFLTEPILVHAILSHLGLPTRPPPLSPARSPPELTFDFDQRAPESLHDQTPAFDPADPEPVPEFEFDQSRGA